MKPLTLTLCIMLFSLSIAAQKQDIIITTTGDTLTGKLHFHKDLVAVVAKKGTSTRVPFANVSSIILKGKTQYIYKGKLYCYEYDYQHNNNSVVLPVLDTLLILKSVYESKMLTLYETTDSEKRIYFFVAQKDSLPEQMMVRYQMQSSHDLTVPLMSSRVMMVQVKLYIAQLKKITSSCATLKRFNWESMDYRSYSFKRVLKIFDECQ